MKDLVRAARKVALDRNTSVNNLVREFLETLVSASGEQDAALRDLDELFRERPFIMGAKTWTRDELHDR